VVILKLSLTVADDVWCVLEIVANVGRLGTGECTGTHVVVSAWVIRGPSLIPMEIPVAVGF
jgi:hypothetical protein